MTSMVTFEVIADSRTTAWVRRGCQPPPGGLLEIDQQHHGMPQIPPSRPPLSWKDWDLLIQLEMLVPGAPGGLR